MAEWYRDGSVAVVAGSKSVTGTGTLWTLTARPGDLFLIEANKLPYEIEVVVSNTALRLKTTYAGSTASNQAYAIIRNFAGTTNAELAARVTAAFNLQQKNIDEVHAWSSGAADGGPSKDGRYPITDPLGAPRLIPAPAKLQAEVDAAVGRTDQAIAGIDQTVEAAMGARTGPNPLQLPRNLQLGTAAYVDWEQLVAYIKARFNLTEAE